MLVGARGPSRQLSEGLLSQLRHVVLRRDHLTWDIDVGKKILPDGAVSLHTAGALGSAYLVADASHVGYPLSLTGVFNTCPDFSRVGLGKRLNDIHRAMYLKLLDREEAPALAVPDCEPGVDSGVDAYLDHVA